MKETLTRYRDWTMRRDPRTSIHKSAKTRGMRVSYSGRGNSVRVGEGSIVQAILNLERNGAAISIGNNTFIGASIFTIAEGVSIGSDVLIAWGSTFSDHDSHALRFEDRANDVRDWYSGRKDWSAVARAPIIIEDKAWIGFGCTILKGVTVGAGSVVAAGSVVTKNVEPLSLVAGNPARLVRQLD